MKLMLPVLIAVALSGSASAQTYSVGVEGSYEVDANVTYARIGGWEGKLDVFSRTDTPGPHPTVIYFHGGGPIGAASRKEYVFLELLPYLEWGWNVVNVEYDLPGLTIGPIAVQNGLCAVRWIASNATKYRIDPKRIYTSGFSSGGWIALMSAMAPAISDWDRPCPVKEEVKVAAVVNWSGNTDFSELLEGPSARPWARGWFQTLPNPLEVGRSISPVNLVNRSVPPIISIHGDADPGVPHSQAVRLHEKLRADGVRERLVTVTGGGHGAYGRERNKELFAIIKQFLTQDANATR